MRARLLRRPERALRRVTGALGSPVRGECLRAKRARPRPAGHSLGGGWEGTRSPARRITHYTSQIKQQCAVRVRERVCIHEHFILSLNIYLNTRTLLTVLRCGMEPSQ
jgi:hypothetical protein